MKLRRVILAAAVPALALAGGGLALASSPGSGTTYTGCITHSRTLADVRIGDRSCLKGTRKITWNQAGPQGPSGVVSTVTKDLHGVSSVPTGGGFVSNSTEVGTVTLKAGTYLLNLNAKATPNVSNTIEVFPQFFVYDQVKNTSFAGDLFNVGSGPLASNNTVIDSYYSGSTVISLTKSTTLYVYAFGYDSDRGGSSYTLDDLSLTATQLNPQS